MTDILCVLWDHDDTLLSTFALRALATTHAAREVLGREVDGVELLRSTHGQSLDKFAGKLGANEADAQAFVNAYRDFYYTRNDQGLDVYTGIPEVLAQLGSRNLKMGVVTAKLGRGARQELDIVGLRQWFSVVVGAEDASRSKPHPEPFVKAMAELGADPSHTLMVGDTPTDVAGARAAGIRVAAALWGTSDRDAVLAAKPDHSLQQPADILALVK
jgi:pyrophosphatase PpaX